LFVDHARWADDHGLVQLSPNRGDFELNTTLTLLDLAGSIALLMWGVHMVA
jgi:hypothetical protein